MDALSSRAGSLPSQVLGAHFTATGFFKKLLDAFVVLHLSFLVLCVLFHGELGPIDPVVKLSVLDFSEVFLHLLPDVEFGGPILPGDLKRLSNSNALRSRPLTIKVPTLFRLDLVSKRRAQRPSRYFHSYDIVSLLDKSLELFDSDPRMFVRHLALNDPHEYRWLRRLPSTPKIVIFPRKFFGLPRQVLIQPLRFIKILRSFICVLPEVAIRKLSVISKELVPHGLQCTPV